MSDMPEFIHRIRRAIRVLVRGFEDERSDEPPYPANWTLAVRIWPDDLDGGYVAQCVEIPGAISQGATVDEALANITDAIEELLEVVVRDSVGDAPRPLPEGETRSIKIALSA